MAAMNPDDYTLTDFIRVEDPELFAKTRPFMQYIEGVKGQGHYSYHRMVTSRTGSRVTVFDPNTGQERELISLASNNYLGLAERPEPTEAAVAATREYGPGMCGSRFLCGTCDLVVKLEQELAEFEGMEEAIVFTTGYQANVGTLSAMLRPGDLALIDRLSHASIVDGCRISGATFRTFRHNDPESLEKMLRRYAPKHRGILIIAEGVFSMDGDTAPLPEMAQLANTHGARLMVDDAHGTGVLGEHGRGTVEHFGLDPQPDILVGTFSKSLAATGGYAAASREVVNYIRHYGRSYMFSASPAPGTIAAVRKSLEILRQEPQLRDKLWTNIRHIAAGLVAAGYKVYPNPPESAILTVFIGSDATVHAMSRDLYEGGLFTSSIVYPAVSPNEGRLRLSLSAAHSLADLDAALAVLTNAGRRHGIL